MGRRRTESEQRIEVAGWRASKRSAGEYARGRGYSASSLVRWAATDAEDVDGGGHAPGFVKVEVVRATPERSEVVVEVGRARVVVSRGFDADLLREVVAALGTEATA